MLMCKQVCPWRCEDRIDYDQYDYYSNLCAYRHNNSQLVREKMSVFSSQNSGNDAERGMTHTRFNKNIQQSGQYLGQNLGSENRLISMGQKSKYTSNALGYDANFCRRTTQENFPPNYMNKDTTIAWQQQYRKTKGLINQKSVAKKWEQQEIIKNNQTEERNLHQTSQNQDAEIYKTLDEVMNQISSPINIFAGSMRKNNEGQILAYGRSSNGYPSDRNDSNIHQVLNVSKINISIDKARNSVERQYEKAVSKSKQSDFEPSQSSENIFDALKKKTKEREVNKRENEESQQSSNFFDTMRKKNIEKQSEQSSNIFDEMRRKSKLPNNNTNSSSQSDEQNIFEAIGQKKKEEKSKVLKSQFNQKYTLEQILQTSSLYLNYLVNQRKVRKKFSLDIPELQQTINQALKIPRHFFFKPERVEFKKMEDELIGEASHNGNQYLCRVNNDRTTFFYQDLRSQQLKNLNGVKCSRLNLQKVDRISPHTEYDHIYQRFYLFSNREQKILVFSQLSMQLLCKIPIQKHVINPHLHFCQISGRNFLMLIGGYICVEKFIAQGNNFIQIFEVNKWQVDLKSRIIKLIIGRISPIFISSKEKNDHKFLILGGNTIAKISSQGVFDFSYEKDINESTNMTGISINCKEISELFDYDQHTNISNVSVKLEDPFCLHSGIVLTFSNNFLVVLPESLDLFQIKISNKEINIIQARTSVFFHHTKQYQKRELNLKIQRENLIIYSIDDRGIFNIQSQQRKKIQKCCCNIY